VALTRASYRVYAMLSDKEKIYNRTGILARSRRKYVSACWNCHGSFIDRTPTTFRKPKSDVQLPLLAQAFPTQRFYPRGKTSFSALAQHLTRQQIQDALAVSNKNRIEQKMKFNNPLLKSLQM
jgi:exodeoxyribonuclease V beta subunit